MKPFNALICFGPAGLAPNLLLNRSYLVKKSTLFFHFSDEAFYWATRRVKVTPPQSAIISAAPEVLLIPSPLGSGDRESSAEPLRGNLSIKEYLSALERLGTVLYDKGYRSIGVKFHMQDRDRREAQARVVSALSRRAPLQVTVLDNNTVIEYHFATRKIIGTGSSALHYAQLFGGQGYLLTSLFDSSGQKWLRKQISGSTLAEMPDVSDIPPAGTV